MQLWGSGRTLNSQIPALKVIIGEIDMMLEETRGLRL